MIGNIFCNSFLQISADCLADDSVAEMCKKELQKILPIIVYEERFRIMAFTLFQNIKNIQANEAQNIAQARQKALGYNDT